MNDLLFQHNASCHNLLMWEVVDDRVKVVIYVSLQFLHLELHMWVNYNKVVILALFIISGQSLVNRLQDVDTLNCGHQYMSRSMYWTQS